MPLIGENAVAVQGRDSYAFNGGERMRMTREQPLTIARLREAEERRCRALLARDVAAMRDLIVPDYRHIHFDGQMDDHDSYLAFLAAHPGYADVTRGPLEIFVYGESAVMVGTIHLSVQWKPADPPQVYNFIATQTWVLDGEWRTVAYQATGLRAKTQAPRPAEPGHS